jgi:hypothetical protein
MPSVGLLARLMLPDWLQGFGNHSPLASRLQAGTTDLGRPMPSSECSLEQSFERPGGVCDIIPPCCAILDRTGRVNVGQGAVMIVGGSGASLRPAIGCWIAQEIGYSSMFLILGSFTLGSIALWLGFVSVLKPACARWHGPTDRRMATALAVAQ